MAAFSRSLEKTIVVVMSKMQINRVLAILTAAPNLLYQAILKPNVYPLPEIMEMSSER